MALFIPHQTPLTLPLRSHFPELLCNKPQYQFSASRDLLTVPLLPPIDIFELLVEFGLLARLWELTASFITPENEKEEHSPQDNEAEFEKINIPKEDLKELH